MPVSIDQKIFRDAMCKLGAAVSVVTTDGPAGRHGLTASAVCSVTDSPPTLLVCVNRAAGAHGVLKENGRLCINVLAGHHEELSSRFGQRGITVEQRFAAGSWRRLITGTPALEGAVVSFDCRVAGITEIGTHSVFFCAVEGIVAASQPEQGLIYFNRNYHRIGTDPEEATA
jgi:flavin reductase